MLLSVRKEVAAYHEYYLFSIIRKMRVGQNVEEFTAPFDRQQRFEGSFLIRVLWHWPSLLRSRRGRQRRKGEANLNLLGINKSTKTTHLP